MLLSGFTAARPVLSHAVAHCSPIFLPGLPADASIASSRRALAAFMKQAGGVHQMEVA